MITFLLYTLLAWVANASLVKILHVSIQQGQWLDKLLNWQDRLYNWDIEGKEFLAKAGGLCELCFSHAITFISFWCYTLFMSEALDLWVTARIDSWLLALFINVLWYLIYISIGTNMALYFIIKLFRK